MKGVNLVKLIQMFNRLSKREKAIFYVSVGFVSLVFLDQALIRPIFYTLRSLDQQVVDLEKNIKKSVRLLGQKDRMLEEAKYYESFSAQIKSPEDGTLTLLKTIQEVANEASVNLLYVKPATSASDEGFYKANFECEGQINQIINFFYALENSKLLLRIEKYAIQPSSQGSSVLKCVATVSMAGVQ